MTWTSLRGAAYGLVLFGLIAVAVGGAHADQVYLRNGDRVSGTLSSFEHNTLVFDSAAVGTVRIPRGQIATITTEDVVTIIFADESTLTGRLVQVSEETMAITGPHI